MSTTTAHLCAGANILPARAKRIALALATAALLAPAQPAVAENSSDLFEARPFYIEAVLGVVWQAPEDSEAQETSSAGLAFGYQFHRNFALELSHTRYNLSGKETRGETFRTNTIALGAKVTFPIGSVGDRLFFELGPAYYQYSYESFASVAVSTAQGAAQLPGILTLEKSGISPYISFGAEWIRSSGFCIGAELGYTSFSVEGADAGFEAQGSARKITAPFPESIRHEVFGVQFSLGYRF